MGKARKSASKSKPPVPAPPPPRSRIDFYICLALAAVTLAVYSQAFHFDFLNYDDPDYVTQNIHVRGGLSGDSIAWAFTSFHAANWSPLTWIAHMADCQLFGLRAGWHHLSSVLLHAAAAVLLFAALKRLTAARWPSAFVASFFALHPLHVESVAWVAERKDVLCAFFWFLAILAYERYVRRPGPIRYAAVLLCFVLGLLAKPMIVTLPAVLLLLDFWPLARTGWRRLLLEKTPFVVLAAASSVVTFFAQQQGYTVRSLALFSLGLRLKNSVVTYGRYLVRTFWPADLAVFYPYRFQIPWWQVVMSAAVVAGLSILAVRWRRARPWFAVGWFWFVGTLIPVIGLVQVGAQSSADRYMYVPMVGLGIVLAWGGAELLRDRRWLAAGIAAAALAICAVLTVWQLRYWENSGTLFAHAAEATSGNYVAYNNLSQYELSLMHNEDAMVDAQRALDIYPAYPEAHTNLGLALRRLGKIDGAEREYRTAIQILPAGERAHAGYGALLAIEGKMPEALREFSEAVQLRPDDDDAHYNLGRTLAALGRIGEAMAEYSEAIRLRPENADARHSLGFLLLSRGHMNEALDQLRAEARYKPGDAAVHYNLGTLLASLGHRDEAAAEFREALRIRPDYPDARRRLEMLGE